MSKGLRLLSVLIGVFTVIIILNGQTVLANVYDCEINIDANKHDFNNKSRASGVCSELQGYYSPDETFELWGPSHATVYNKEIIDVYFDSGDTFKVKVNAKMKKEDIEDIEDKKEDNKEIITPNIQDNEKDIKPKETPKYTKDVKQKEVSKKDILTEKDKKAKGGKKDNEEMVLEDNKIKKFNYKKDIIGLEDKNPVLYKENGKNILEFDGKGNKRELREITDEDLNKIDKKLDLEEIGGENSSNNNNEVEKDKKEVKKGSKDEKDNEGNISNKITLVVVGVLIVVTGLFLYKRKN